MGIIASLNIMQISVRSDLTRPPFPAWVQRSVSYYSKKLSFFDVGCQSRIARARAISDFFPENLKDSDP